MKPSSIASRFGRICTLTLICAAAALAAPGPRALADCVAAPAGLVSWWRAESDAADSAGGNSGTLLNGLAFTNGQVGLAFNFDGVNDGVSVPDAPSLNFGANADFSLEAWIRPLASDTFSGVMTVVDKRETSAGIFGYVLFLQDGKLACQLGDGAPNGFESPGPDLRDGAFHHVAWTVNRSATNGGKLYVDGQVVQTFEAALYPGSLANSRPLLLGPNNDPVNTLFKGLMDEVSLYNRALTTEEVQAVYNAGSGGKCLTATLPVIGSQPASQTETAGHTVTFTVTATGTPPLNYQWRFAGTNINGATTPSLVLSNVQLAAAGTYSVIVSNSAGAIISSNAVLTVIPPPPCAAAPAGLVSWWRAESDAADSAGGNSGELLNGLAFTNGQVGLAFNFDGVNDGVSVPDAPSLNFGANADFSLEAWIQPLASGTFSGVMTIVDKRETSAGVFGYSLYLQDGKLACQLGDGAPNGFESPGPDLRDGLFHHVAWTVNRSATNGGKLYVDGQVVRTFEAALYQGSLANSRPLLLGPNNDPVNTIFKGLMDEVSLYNRALTTSEVQRIYNAGSGGKCVQSTPGLVTSVASPMTLNRQTGLMEQHLRLTNQGTNTLFAARVFLCGLPTNSVYNASGFANGCPFVQYNLPLAPGASVDFLMEYYLRRAGPDPTLVAVEVPRTEPPGPSGTPLNIDRSVMLTDGRFLIEFTTTPGRVYTIQYSDDTGGPFKTAVPAITAPANRLQWLDDGPPKTDSKPTGTSRFYRVFENTAP